MSTSAKMILHTIAPNGRQAYTLELTFPRFILAELRTHRVLVQQDECSIILQGTDSIGNLWSMNSASSRAIPTARFIQRVEDNPFVPPAFGKNKKGMQSTEVLAEDENAMAELIWREATEDALRHASRLEKLGVHKQYANRILEPFAYHTILMTGTELENFFGQRCTPQAQPEFRHLAENALAAIKASKPKTLWSGDWHLPLIHDEDWPLIDKYITDHSIAGIPGDDILVQIAKRVSTARVARVSYLTHDGRRDIGEDMRLYEETLQKHGHWAPFEHVLRAGHPDEGHVWSGVVRGYRQFRKEFPHESGATD